MPRRKIAGLTSGSLLACAVTEHLGTAELPRSIRYIPHRASRRLILRALASRVFPIRFFVRNLRTLAAEPGWQRLSMRSREAFTLRLLVQRSRFLLEVKTWREAQGPSPSLPVPTGDEDAQPSPETVDYCDHCGACCEIASGLPEFPEAIPIPRLWRQIFGLGMGPWHRFCSFLWEDRLSGLSVCAIHPWRPLACRAFEQEECRFAKKELEEQDA